MTSWDIQQAIMRERWRRSFCLTNYTPSSWWESDVFEITAAGYFREYEVKVSRGDFFADAKKGGSNWVNGTGYVKETKHGLLAQRSPRGPVQFWFATPVGLLKREDLPEWAGLIEVHDKGERWGAWRYEAVEVIKAPRLHGEKMSDKRKASARGTCYYRMHDALGTKPPRHHAEGDLVDEGAGI